MACQLAINGIFKNMSQLKTKLPGLLPKVEYVRLHYLGYLPKVEYVPVHIVCDVMDDASSMKSFFVLVPGTCCGGCPCSSVLNTLPTC